jgi:hypothetical protein
MPIGEEPSKVKGLSRFCSEGSVVLVGHLVYRLLLDEQED